MSEDRRSGMSKEEQRRLAAAETDIAHMRREIAEVNQKVDQLLAFFNNARGAWWMILIVATVITTVSGLAIAAWAKVFK